MKVPCLGSRVDILPGMNAGASTSAVPSPIEGSGTAWVLLGAWALSPARPTPIPPRHSCRGFSALLVTQFCAYTVSGDLKLHQDWQFENGPFSSWHPERKRAFGSVFFVSRAMARGSESPRRAPQQIRCQKIATFSSCPFWYISTQSLTPTPCLWCHT